MKYRNIAVFVFCSVSIGLLSGCFHDQKHQAARATTSGVAILEKNDIEMKLVQNPDTMAGVIKDMAIGTPMTNGALYDGHNGYYDMSYTGPPKTILVSTVTFDRSERD